MTPDRKLADEALQAALAKHLALVLVPGAIFVFGLIYLVFPPAPPLSAMNGCYQIENGPRLRIAPPNLIVESGGVRVRTIPIAVEYGKRGFQVLLRQGLRFERRGDGSVLVTATRAAIYIEAIARRGKRPALQLSVDPDEVELPQVDC
ncbi:hypothetical protein [Sphingomonas sp.]|uniref:hypothetical protein n=1 Tax=Sphingomonas sp. TaxID=28214 RepID=UPI001B174688|nr:hypothetical protein [Sphingomonas sp.]MBO9714100.1 hypothetical protein [Sphingomonas sp.]